MTDSNYDEYDEQRIGQIANDLKKYSNSELEAFVKGYTSGQWIDSLRTLEALKRIGREDLVKKIKEGTSVSPETKRLLEEARDHPIFTMEELKAIYEKYDRHKSS